MITSIQGTLTSATPLWFVVVLLFVAGAIRSLQMTALGALQYADVPREQMTGASTYAGLNQHVTRAVGIALAALLLNMLPALRGETGADPSLFDFRIAFIIAGVLSGLAMIRYFALPNDAGAHVSAGRS